MQHGKYKRRARKGESRQKLSGGTVYMAGSRISSRGQHELPMSRPPGPF